MLRINPYMFDLVPRAMPAVLVVISVICISTGRAQTAPSTEPAPATRHLIVGIKQAVPFAFKDEAGTWQGLTVELWRRIAADIHCDFEYREFDLPNLTKAVSDGRVDVGIGALSITPERERTMDFSHPFYNSGLSIATASHSDVGMFRAIERFLSPKVLGILALFMLGTLVVGLVIWVLERKHNPEQFGGSWSDGLGSGLWWSIVTMTTVGYGDKAPRTFGGRMVALLWMLVSIILVATFTASITATLTIDELEGTVRRPQDLPFVRVGTVSGSTSYQYLAAQRVRATGYRSAAEGLLAVRDGKLDAFVYDAPMLRYLASNEFDGGILVLPVIFEPQYYSIAMPAGSALRKPINEALLIETRREWWRNELNDYFGN